MITITRNLARQLRTVCRQALRLASKSLSPPVYFQAGPDGLLIRMKSAAAMVEYRQAGKLESTELRVPFELFRDCEGRNHDEVTIKAEGQGRQARIAAQWLDKGIPQRMHYDHPKTPNDSRLPEFPRQPAENPPRLLRALKDACDTADAEATRYSLDCIQLGGKSGSIAATDGQQLLRQSGFVFPWDADLLVPANRVFGCCELPPDVTVKIGLCTVGKKDVWVAFRIEPWTIYLRTRPEARFPQVDDHIRAASAAQATVRLTDADAEFLTDALKRLPTEDDFHYPVTIDLNGQVAIRAKAADATVPTEVILSQSVADGAALRLNVNRTYLGRALKMGLRQFNSSGPETPLQGQDDSRAYVWAVLGAQEAIAPHPQAIRIESPRANNAATDQTKPKSTRQRNPTTMPTRKTDVPANGATNGQPAPGPSSAEALIQQAEDLKESLRDSLTKATQLIAALKQHKKAARAVDSALSSLRQLQTHSA